jgi:hypothetical protein
MPTWQTRAHCSSGRSRRRSRFEREEKDPTEVDRRKFLKVGGLGSRSARSTAAARDVLPPWLRLRIDLRHAPGAE